MALTNTSLASAFGANALIFNATASTGATVGGFAKVDDEYMIITAINGTYLDVRARGSEGTIARAHTALSPVTFGIASDLPTLAPGTLTLSQSLGGAFGVQSSVGVDGAIVDTATLAGNQTIVLTKATAGAYTLAAPSKGSDGLLLFVTSGTAAAHTVTYAAGFYGDAGSSDIATFAAKVGASMTLVARAGAWGVQALANVTIA